MLSQNVYHAEPSPSLFNINQREKKGSLKKG